MASSKKKSKKRKRKTQTPRHRVKGSKLEQHLIATGYKKGKSGWLSPDGKTFFPL